MESKVTLSALISRVESAEPWSRELADAVLIAAGWTLQVGYWKRPDGLRMAKYFEAPDPLRNLDAAAALPGWRIEEVSFVTHWSAYQATENRLGAYIVGVCPIAGAEGMARAMTAAVLRSMMERTNG